MQAPDYRQTRISDSGELESQPLTWDREPLYSPATVAEGLFNADAFEQMPGQTAMEGLDIYIDGDGNVVADAPNDF